MIQHHLAQNVLPYLKAGGVITKNQFCVEFEQALLALKFSKTCVALINVCTQIFGSDKILVPKMMKFSCFN